MTRKLISIVLCICFLLIGAVPAFAAKADPLPPPIELPGTISWPEGQALPSFAPPVENMDKMETNGLSFSDHVTLAGLQGLANREQPRILTDNGGYGWPDDNGLTFTEVAKLTDLILKYKDIVKGLSVYNPDVPDTINVATTAAGLFDLLVVSPEQAEELTAEPFNFTITKDFRDEPITNKLEAYEYIFKNYWEQCNRRVLFGLNTDSHAHLRDFVVAVKGAVIWLNPGDETERELIAKYFDGLTFGAYYAGWWPDEGQGIYYATGRGVATAPADFYMNYTVYSGLPREIAPAPVPAKPKLKDGKIYVSLNISDGDNLQYDQHSLRNEFLWSHPMRGKVPIGWTISPLLLDAGPGLLNYFYRTATPNDVLISGPSGAGYTNIGYWKIGSKALKNYNKVTNEYFEKTGLDIITIWGETTGRFAKHYAKNIPALLGLTLQERLFAPIIHTKTNVPAFWFGNDLTNEGMTYEPNTEKAFKELSLLAETNPEKATFVGVQFVAWDAKLDLIVKLTEDLEAAFPGKFEFVRTDHLMMLVNESVGRPINLALQKKAAASSADGENTPDKAFDRTFATGWKASETGESWLQIDLGTRSKLNRYVLKNAGANNLDASLNTAAWEIQVSDDGEKWKTVDTQSGNTESIVYQNLRPKATGRYVRVVVTEAGADGIAAIQDFEVYGVKAVGFGRAIINKIKGIPAATKAFFDNLGYLLGIVKHVVFGFFQGLFD